jgi:hypothetical protein
MLNSQNIRKTALGIFIGIELCLLVWWLFRLDGHYDNEDFLLFQILLSAIGFPSTAAALVLISSIDLLVPIFAGHTKLAAAAVWLLLALVAYVQWFVWAPKLVQRIRGWWHRRSEA